MAFEQRTIRISRAHIAVNRTPRKAFPTALKTLGDHIYARRFEKGLSHAEVALKLGVPKPLVKSWETDLQTPTEAEWRALADLLNLDDEMKKGNPTAE